MNNKRVAYVNGEIVPEIEAKVSYNDVGFLYGDAVFDTTRTFGGKIFRLQQHLDRFFPVSYTHLTLPTTPYV